MAPKIGISQDAFDAVVNENMEEFGMDAEEAVEDAIHTFKLQGVDLSGRNPAQTILHSSLSNSKGDACRRMNVINKFETLASSGIITTARGDGAREEHPVTSAANRLRTAVLAFKEALGRSSPLEEAAVAANGRSPAVSAREPEEEQAVPCDRWGALDQDLAQALDGLDGAVREGGADAASLAGRSGATETAVEACEALIHGNADTLEKGLRVLDLLLAADANQQAFLKAGGPKLIMTTLAARGALPSLVHLSAAVAATAGTRFELNKEEFMDANAHRDLVALLKRHVAHPGAAVGTANALRVFSTADDGRVAASKTFGNARRIAEAGAVEAILDAARAHAGNSEVLATMCSALKAVAVNDEICRSVADHGGVDLMLRFLSEANVQRKKTMAQSACTLLCQLAGSDQNKEAIVAAGGLPTLVGTVGVFGEEPAVMQEGFAAIGALALRQPGIAELAVQAGAADVAAEAMEAHPGAAGMQRQACMMLRNLAVRNLENRPLILEKGLEPLIRQAKASHEQCRDVASAALRDLGFDDYNS